MNSSTCSGYPVLRWLKLAVLLLVIAFLTGPRSPATAQSPEPPPESPVTERYGDITALPVPPLAPAAQTQKPDSGDRVEINAGECYAPSADLYNKIVMQTYDNTWQVRILLSCFEENPLMITKGGNNFFPRLNRGATRVVYVSDSTGNLEIFSMAADGSNARQLTSNPAADSQPTWSPDGWWVAFASNRSGKTQIFTMESDGSGVKQFTNSDTNNITPDWSPDGKKLAWVEASEETGRIAVADLANPQGKVYITPPLPYLSSPMWASDGNALAFEFDGDKDGFFEIGLVSADGADLATLLDNPVDYVYVDYEMGSWAPSGTYLAYTRIEYGLYQGKLYFSRADTDKFVLGSTSYAYRLPHSSRYDFHPHVQSNDLTKPATTFRPLPLYSPAEGVQVSWHVEDTGPAPLFSSWIDSRTGETGDWNQQWLFITGTGVLKGNTFERTETFSGSPGTTVYFRGFGTDEALNTESMPAGYTVFTHLYDWMLRGQIQDNRGNALEGIVSTSSLPPMNEFISDSDGQAVGYFAAPGSVSIQTGAPGFGTLEPIQLNNTYTFLNVLPPLANALANGNFETTGNPLASWQTNGALPAAAGAGHSGARSAQLGQECPWPCLSDPVQIITKQAGHETMAIDQDRTLHIVLNNEYFTLSPNGEVSEPYPFPTDLFDSDTQIEVDSNGNLHALFYKLNGLYYQMKPKGGDWQPPELVSSQARHSIFGYKTMTVDALGRIHVAYLIGSPTMYYRMRDQQGNWSAPIHLAPEEEGRSDKSAHSIFLAVESDSTVHVLTGWSAGVHNFAIYKQILPDGTIIRLTDFIEGKMQSLTLGPDGTLHAVGIQPSTVEVRHWIRPVGGTWKEKEPYLGGYGFMVQDVLVDQAGDLHVLCQNPAEQACYLIQRNGDTTFQVYEDNSTFGYKSNVHQLFAIGPMGEIHILSQAQAQDGTYYFLHRTNMVSAQESQGSLSQEVTISETMHQPTLSFLYRFPASADKTGGGLSVTVTPVGGEPVTVFTSQSAPQWQHGWADLSEWVGQTVTITFTNTQSAGKMLSPIQIDEVSLGAWTTPSLEGIDPPQAYFDPDAPVTITLTGQNFMPGAQVLVDGQPASSVTWIDENHIQFTMPKPVRPGNVPVTVANPSGVRSANLLLFEIGSHIYLPMMRK